MGHGILMGPGPSGSPCRKGGPIMIKLDCLGDMCPVPALRLQKQLATARPGQRIELVTDHSCVPRSIGEYCAGRGLLCQVTEAIPGVWEITITVPGA